MITPDGRFDWMVHDPGPLDRILSAFRTPIDALGHHSMVGLYNGGQATGAYTAMRDASRFPTAWHFTVCNSDGMAWCHYAVWAHLQHGHALNTLGPGGETTGGMASSPGGIHEPLTPAAVKTWRRIHADINEYRAKQGKGPLLRDSRPKGQFIQGAKRGLVEHREMAPAWNTTQCPSERYAPLWASYKENDMTPSEAEAIARKVFDEATPIYFRDLIKKYFVDGIPGDFTDPADAEVLAALRAASIPEHEHEGGNSGKVKRE